MCRIISLEGIDGSGKTAQFYALKKELISQGKIVKTMEFPAYDGFFGERIGELLSGKCEVTAETVDSRSMSLWFAMDRFLQFKNFDKTSCDYLLLNRYVLSNAVYQSVRELRAGRADIAEWIFKMEFGILGLPKPDITLVLDVDENIAKSNVSKKGYRDYVGERSDVYESSESMQSLCRKMYLECAARFDGIIVIDCMNNGSLRPKAQIAKQISNELASRKII